MFCFPSQATDVAREQRWIDQTVDMIFDGEAVYLDAEGHQFLSIYTESETPSDRGIIVTHGTGFHPDYEQVVHPVRVKMTEHGWHTLSIQMPLLANDAEYEDYVSVYPEIEPRMQAAEEFLAERGIREIAVVAHSQGATMASYYIANAENNIKALVAIGMSAQHVQPEINSAESLKKITIPVLDIYGSNDFPAVLRTAKQRQLGAAHNDQYSQQVINGAFHFFDAFEDELIGVVVEWLEAVP